MEENRFEPKDLLGIRDLSAKDILCILTHAKTFKDILSRPNKQVPTLRGKTLVNFFFEPSTRTRVSFDLAAKYLGATSINLSSESSSFKKGETLFDTIQNIQAMGVDGFIVRHGNGGVPQFMANHLHVPVINAGDGFNEHPTQGLTDLFTMLAHQNTLEGKNVLILGDIAHSRVARSNIWGLQKLGAHVTVCGPKTLMPVGISAWGVAVAKTIEDVIGDMDFINVLRIQHERQEVGFIPSIREFRREYCLTPARLAKAKPTALVLHPGPVNRGVELESSVVDGPQTVILEQVTNGIAVRMAVLYLLMARGQ